MVLGRRISDHPRAQCYDPINVWQQFRRRHVEASVRETNEWDILRNQFDALTHDESVESIEDILDAQFRRRFDDLINQIAQPNSTTRCIDRCRRHRS